MMVGQLTEQALIAGPFCSFVSHGALQVRGEHHEPDREVPVRYAPPLRGSRKEVLHALIGRHLASSRKTLPA